jgi:hypothetical protein
VLWLNKSSPSNKLQGFHCNVHFAGLALETRLSRLNHPGYPFTHISALGLPDIQRIFSRDKKKLNLQAFPKCLPLWIRQMEAICDEQGRRGLGVTHHIKNFQEYSPLDWEMEPRDKPSLEVSK